MKFILYKLSSPGWQKTFKHEDEVEDELIEHICGECIAYSSPKSIDDMLDTDCGREFSYDVIYNEFE